MNSCCMHLIIMYLNLVVTFFSFAIHLVRILVPVTIFFFTVSLICSIFLCICIIVFFHYDQLALTIIYNSSIAAITPGFDFVPYKGL